MGLQPARLSGLGIRHLLIVNEAQIEFIARSAGARQDERLLHIAM